MTMPHLINCSHSSDGWCLKCVKELNNELEYANHRINVLLETREQNKKALEEKNKVLETIKILVSEE